MSLVSLVTRQVARSTPLRVKYKDLVKALKPLIDIYTYRYIHPPRFSFCVVSDSSSPLSLSASALWPSFLVISLLCTFHFSKSNPFPLSNPRPYYTSNFPPFFIINTKISWFPFLSFPPLFVGVDKKAMFRSVSLLSKLRSRLVCIPFLAFNNLLWFLFIYWIMKCCDGWIAGAAAKSQRFSQMVSNTVLLLWSCILFFPFHSLYNSLHQTKPNPILRFISLH